MSWDVIIKQLIKEARDKKEKKSEAGHRERRVFKVYSLGAQYGRAYFTRREAECMARFLKGKTLTRVAEDLQLSPRTVEFYLKNMKAKLGCRSKYELLEKVHASDFMLHVDFEVN